MQLKSNSINSLFNDKTIKRLVSKTILTVSQKRAINEWIAKLEADQLKKEVENYLEFSNTILLDILGYKKDEIKYERNNIEFSICDDTNKRLVCFEVKGTNTKE